VRIHAFLVQQVQKVRNRSPVAGCEFTRCGSTADLFRCFEHRYFFACFCQVGCAYEAIVAAADNNDINVHIAPMSWMMALARCDWTPGWTEAHSNSYGLKEAQVQAWLDKPGPGNWCNMNV